MGDIPNPPGLRGIFGTLLFDRCFWVSRAETCGIRSRTPLLAAAHVEVSLDHFVRRIIPVVMDEIKVPFSIEGGFPGER